CRGQDHVTRRRPRLARRRDRRPHSPGTRPGLVVVCRASPWRGRVSRRPVCRRHRSARTTREEAQPHQQLEKSVPGDGVPPPPPRPAGTGPGMARPGEARSERGLAGTPAVRAPACGGGTSAAHRVAGTWTGITSRPVRFAPPYTFTIARSPYDHFLHRPADAG